jgi:hypothetical protein
MSDRDFHEHTRDGIRIVIYRAAHPETHIMGWAGFVESDICTQLGWSPNPFRITWRALKARRRHR